MASVTTTKTIKKAMLLYKAVTAAEASASSGVITVTTNIPSDEFVYVTSVKRSGVPIGGFSFNYYSDSGIIVVGNSGAGTLTSGDIITVIGEFMK